ncbi:MAG: hypothetical protein HYR90_04100 [Candidatus Andersenbacteria bacterium]|nr:hypothetical protein [Candidatus Andersenbacteria bacterium]MBI3251271.1 hypothetical protein [Candidatus Andersenbacteria bacterium]
MNSSRQRLAGIGTAILLLALLFVPTPHKKVLTHGTDSFKTHEPLYGDIVLSQKVESPEKVIGIGILAVDLNRSHQLSPLTITVRNNDRQTITQEKIAPENIVDDTFVWAQFRNEIIPPHTPFEIQLTAPEATRETALGIRFDEQDNHLALGVIESIPAWYQVQVWQQEHPTLSIRLITMLIGSLVFIFLGFKNELLEKRRTFLLILSIIVLVSIGIRIPTAGSINSLFGGDALNYVAKARAWANGDDPFAADARKAPLLPFLLLPAVELVDPLMLGRGIGIASAAIGVILLVLIARQLKLPAEVALGAGILLAVNRMWWWESVHGLSNIPFATLLLATTFAFLKNSPYLTGIFAGLTTLMRFEGALVAAIIMPWAWIQSRNWQMVLRSSVPILILISIPLVLWPFTGESGVRSAEDITSDPGLYIAWDKGDLINNFSRFRVFIGRLWILREFVGNQFSAFGVGTLLGVGMAALSSWRYKKVFGAVPYIAAILLLSAIAYNHHDSVKFAALSITGAAGVGLGYLIVQKPKQLLPLTVMLAAQILTVTVILPKDRYYTAVIPFVALFIVTGIYAVGYWNKRWSRFGILVAIGAFIGLTYADTRLALPGLISNYNEKTPEATALITAARHARTHTATIAIPDYATLFMQTHIPKEQYVIVPLEGVLTATEELRELRKRNVTYVLVRSPEFPISMQIYPDQFVLEITYSEKSEGNALQLYRLRP